MKRKFLVFMVLIFFTLTSIFSQTFVIKNQVVPKLDIDYSCNCYIPLVRIYLTSHDPNKLFFNIENYADMPISPNTAITSNDGRFTIEIPEVYSNNSLVFDHWAYKTKVVSIKELLTPYHRKVKLEYEKILLPCLKIRSSRSSQLSKELVNQYTLLKDIEQKTYSRFIPDFPGGSICFNAYLTKKIHTKRIKIKKPLIVEFTVSHAGVVENIEVLSKNNQAVNNAIRMVFEQSPEWTPARPRSPNMKYRFALPIIFDSRKRSNK